MKNHHVVLSVAVPSVMGIGLVFGLLFLLGSHLSPVSAAAESATGFAPAPDGVITVCQGGGCDYDVIQDAVDAAAEGDEIRVAAGTYTGVNHRGGLAQVIYIAKTVTIRGGYAVDDWTTSDPATNPTILDAQGQGRVLYLTGDIEPTIIGLRITGGDADGLGGGVAGWAPHAGGGVYVDGADGTLRENDIFSNTANLGAGICAKGGDIALVQNRVTSNVASGKHAGGGGLTLWQTRATVTDNDIAGNRAAYGGGGYLLGNYGLALIARNFVTGNSADNGGGLYVISDQSAIRQNELRANVAAGGGGGAVVHKSGSRLSANMVIGNEANEGGGIWVYDTDTTLVNMVIADNRAHAYGGGLYIQEARADVLHTTSLVHATLARNRSIGEMTTGTGVWLASGKADLVNTIIVDHTTGVHAAAGTTVTLEGTLWGDGAWANGTDWDGPGTVLTGAPEDNVWGDPDFVAPQAGDYHVGVSSAAIDRGGDAGVTADIDDQPRPIPAGGQVDLGADESTGIDLSSSSKSASVDEAEPGEVITYLINLSNTGPFSAEQVALRDPVPGSTSYVTGSARAASGVLTEGNSIRWSGTVSPHESITLTFAVTLNENVVVRNTAVVTDAYGTRLSLQAWVNARHVYVPLLLRASP